MMMRRYRFIEDGLTIGKPETEDVIAETRRHFKLWNRVDANHEYHADSARCLDVISQSDRLMFSGLSDLLQNSDDHCKDCKFRLSYGAEVSGCFGGVELCAHCEEDWKLYIESLPQRAEAVFPLLTATRCGFGNIEASD